MEAQRQINKHIIDIILCDIEMPGQETSVTESSENTKSPKQVVEECVDYIMKNLKNEELSVNEIAAHCFLNPIYLNRIKKEKNISISQFIIREKMTLAAKLLENPASQAAAVTRQVGYPNYSYFSSTFKKYYGCTPAQYHENIVK